MISVHEFSSGYADFRRRVRRFVPIGLLCFVAWFGIMAIGGAWFKKRGEENWTVLILSLAPMVAGVAAAAWTLRRDPRLLCPHCRKSMDRAAPWVIATRNCCGCGRRMLEEPATTESASVLYLKTEELQRAVAVEGRRELTWVMVAMFVALSWMGLYAGVLAWLRARNPEAYPDLYLPIFLVPCLLVSEVLVWRRWGSGRADRSLRCPHCAEWLLEFGTVAQATGNCGHCGRRILDDLPKQPDRPVESTVELSIDEFSKACTSWTTRVMAVMLGGMVMIAGGLGVGMLLIDMLLIEPVRDGDSAALVAYKIVLGLGPFILAVVLWFLAMAVVLKRRDSRLSCPSCKADLLQDRQVIIATRRCRKCHQQVLADMI